MKSLNEQLNALYAGKWGAISEALHEEAQDGKVTPTNPLLLHVGNEAVWQNAALRVMVFGQETNDWEKHPDKSIKHLCGVYDGFYNKGACYHYGVHFWNGIKHFKETLAEKNPNKQIAYLWNNIIKIGKAGEKGRPPKDIYAQEHLHFHVIPEEVNILQPNVLLFFTGPNYDDVIRDNFGKVGYTAVPPFGERQLARLSIPALPGIASAFRTYHPHYLWQHGINSYFKAMVEGIS
jgi:hypothetical protein